MVVKAPPIGRVGAATKVELIGTQMPSVAANPEGGSKTVAAVLEVIKDVPLSFSVVSDVDTLERISFPARNGPQLTLVQLLLALAAAATQLTVSGMNVVIGLGQVVVI